MRACVLVGPVDVLQVLVSIGTQTDVPHKGGKRHRGKVASASTVPDSVGDDDTSEVRGTHGDPRLL
jgi:hypothetical protein